MAGASAAATGGNMISSLGTALIQSQTAMTTNKTNIMYQDSIVNRGEHAFTDIGLPKAMYYGGNSITSPNTMFHLGGSNFYEGSGVNTNLPVFTSNPYQQYNHGGQPKYLGKGQASSRGISFQSGGFNSTTQGPVSPETGQTDRLGLGNGRYSAVPPPTLTYNSVGTQAGATSRDRFSQTTAPKNTYMRDSFAQVYPGNMMNRTENLYKGVPNPSYGFSASSAQFNKINPKFL